MEVIGSFEAKTHWSALLDKVALGTEVVITKRGKPIARLIPEVDVQKERSQNAVLRLKAMRKGLRLGGLSWKDLRDAGRQ